MNRNPPTESGIYWARSHRCQWWDLIVEIAGNAPYLRVEWVYDRKEAKLTTDRAIEEFGPEIVQPPAPELSREEKYGI